MKKTITIFGSSRPNEGEAEYDTAYNLGRLLAQKGFDVCTGGYQGIMNAVSRGAAENGAEAIGITIEGWGVVPSKYLTKEIKCASLNERLEKLVSAGDAYVVLQGGTGTLLELALVWELINKRMLKIKPIASHSVMWKEIAAIIDKQLTIEKRVAGLIRNFSTPEEITDYLYHSLKEND
jgi:uncharacterized protein (TIGR00730 family)